MKHCKLITFIAAIITSVVIIATVSAAERPPRPGSAGCQLVNPPNTSITWNIYAYDTIYLYLENLSRQTVSATLTTPFGTLPSQTYIMLPYEITPEVMYHEPAFMSDGRWSFELSCTQSPYVCIIGRARWY